MCINPAIILPLSLFCCLSFYPILIFALYSKCTITVSVCLSLIVASRLCSDDTLAKWIRTNAVSKVHWFGEYQPLKEKEVLLVIPHGMFCTEGFVSCIDKGLHHGYTMLIDNKLFYSSPTTLLVGRAIGPHVSPLNHKTIIGLMQKGRSLGAFPGGFVEAVGYNENTYSINTNTYNYWIKQCQTYGYNIRIHFIYNQNDFYKQSSFMTHWRTQIAGKYHIPLIMPYYVKKPDTMYARCLYYHSGDISKESVDAIKSKIEVDLKACYDKDTKDIKHMTAKLNIISKL